MWDVQVRDSSQETEPLPFIWRGFHGNTTEVHKTASEQTSRLQKRCPLWWDETRDQNHVWRKLAGTAHIYKHGGGEVMVWGLSNVRTSVCQLELGWRTMIQTQQQTYTRMDEPLQNEGPGMLEMLWWDLQRAVETWMSRNLNELQHRGIEQISSRTVSPRKPLLQDVTAKSGSTSCWITEVLRHVCVTMFFLSGLFCR